MLNSISSVCKQNLAFKGMPVTFKTDTQTVTCDSSAISIIEDEYGRNSLGYPGGKMQLAVNANDVLAQLGVSLPLNNEVINLSKNSTSSRCKLPPGAEY
ncbi:MAG TPA: hypothetical protein DDW90_01795 [Cyanobacteria bacterium UBA9971]|nr:hypothetical protein [Cyanobacteria bacterium UBA9971]